MTHEDHKPSAPSADLWTLDPREVYGTDAWIAEYEAHLQDCLDCGDSYLPSCADPGLYGRCNTRMEGQYEDDQNS